MKWNLVFLLAVAALEGAAVIVYVLQGQYRLALIWACYGLATVALSGVK